jgi:hypothetical protein
MNLCAAKSLGKQLVASPRSSLRDNIKMKLTEIDCEDER